MLTIKSISLAATLMLVAPMILTTGAMAAAPSPCSSKADLDSRVTAALSAKDRPADQRAKDEQRLSEVRFVLSHVKPGDHVLDIGAGGGYASMILSTAVCNGEVDSQNPQNWDVAFKQAAAREAMAALRPNIHLLQADFDKIPVPAKPYSVIFIGTVYHDTYNEAGHDAIAMDKALFATLKPGGLVIVTDHKTAPGAGFSQTSSLHRIEEATVLADFKAAGFELVEDSAALANPADNHTLMVFDPAIRGKTDRMALVFRKPLK